MLYHLFNYLQDTGFPGIRLMTYLSFRAMAAIVLSMLIAFFAGGRIIRWLQRKQIGESIRDLGLAGQMEKKGTPTMGGIIILVSLLISVLLICDLSNTVLRVQKTTNKKPTRAEAIFTDFIRLVEQNYKSERRVGWYGQQLCITPKYLSETVKAISGRTPNEWIDNYVVLEMRVQLKNSMKSIKDIANDLNFPNQSFMGKYFKEHVGLSPTDYRRT